MAACHCIDCQRRTGAPFGVGAFYPVEAVTISGAPKGYVRAAASGGEVRFYFCSDCGSTVYWKADNLPAMIGVAVGTIADPARGVKANLHANADLARYATPRFHAGDITVYEVTGQ